MNPGNILVVFRKELRDVLRDRRALISMIVVPVVVIPLLMVGMGGMVERIVSKARKETVPVTLVGDENAPLLAKRLRAVERFSFVDPPEELETAVSDKRVRVAIRIPPGFEDALRAGERPRLEILFHEGDLKSEAALNDARRVAREYRDELVAATLTASGLDADDLEPFSVQARNVASREQVTGRAAGGLLPYIIILMGMTGAMYPAIDLTAGEKERGTMETILASAVSRLDLVLGKFLTVLSASLATVLLSLLSLAFTGLVIAPRIIGGSEGSELADLIQVNPYGLAGIVVLIFPLTVLFSAALLTIALFAKSYKEAQSYVSPLLIVVIIPAVFGMLPGVELDARMALIPIVGTSLASKELLAGSFQWGSLGVIFGSSCLYAVIALAIAVRIFQRESVLFRS